jgi:hypothetical protein
MALVLLERLNRWSWNMVLHAEVNSDTHFINRRPQWYSSLCNYGIHYAYMLKYFPFPLCMKYSKCSKRKIGINIFLNIAFTCQAQAIKYLTPVIKWDLVWDSSYSRRFIWRWLPGDNGVSSTLRCNVTAHLHFLPWSWKQHVLPKS